MIRIEIGNTDRFIADLEKAIIAERDKVMTDLHAGLMRATPVDTGQARNGWQLTLGDDAVIENAVPYIGRLNDGHSKQAPKLFIEAEIKRVTR